MSQFTTPRVFVSAVSSDLHSARKAVNEGLMRIECLPIEESTFGTEYGPIREMLRRKIASCQAVIHLVGRDYGGEPDPQSLPNGQPRRSWTQIEYDLARELGKTLFLIVCDDAFPFDPAAQSEAGEKIALQNAHRAAVLADEHLWHTVRSMDECRQQVDNLKVSLDEVRNELRRQQRRHRLQTALAAAAVVLVLIGFLYGLSQLGKKVDDTGGTVSNTQEDVARVKELAEDEAVQRDADKKLQQQFAERFLENLIRDKNLPVEDARKEALAELPKLTGLSVEAIRQIIDGRVTELAKDAGATPLERARAALTIADYDRVLAEAANQRSESRELEMLAGAAALAKFRAEPRPQWNELALGAFQRGLALSDAETEPRQWANAAILVAYVMHDLARYDDAEPLLRKAWKLREATLGSDNSALAPILNNLAQLLQATNRPLEAEPLMRRALAIEEQSHGAVHPYVATSLANLGSLLQATGRLAEAEPLMRRALTIDEYCYEADHPNVDRGLNNLARLLQDTNRLAEAESLMRRALVSHEQSFGPEHPNVAGCLHNLAHLLHDTNRLAEAELLMRRALAISGQSYGTKHPNAATCLNNLASLFLDTNRLAEAESLMRRALAIHEQSFGPQHPNVATTLNNLGSLLQATNRVAETEPLMRRALAIDERSYGAEHLNVAIRLNNLGGFLRATNRWEEAVPLVRRALAIDERSYGAEHPTVANSLNNLAGGLHDTNRLDEAEPLMRRALAIFEQLYGSEHPNVATCLNNLALLLWDSNRLAEAEPLMRHMATIRHRFKQVSGHQRPYARTYLQDYRDLLAAMGLPPDEIESQVEAAMQVSEPLKPIAPRVEQLLGSSKSVAEVLGVLDRRYKTEGKCAIWFVPLDEPISPHLDQLLKPNTDALDAMGYAACNNGRFADAVVLCDESLTLLEGRPERAQEAFTIRTNRAAALRKFGDVKRADKELRRLLRELDEDSSTPSLTLGLCRYHLASCQWRLGNHAEAQQQAEESLQAFAQASDEDPVPQVFIESAEKLLAYLKENKQRPRRSNVDVTTDLDKARARFQTRQDLATLPLNKPALPLVDQLLGPTQSTEEVLDILDRQYREQGKPAIWFLPLDEAISPHLVELLGPLPLDKEE